MMDRIDEIDMIDKVDRIDRIDKIDQINRIDKMYVIQRTFLEPVMSSGKLCWAVCSVLQG